MKQMPLTEVLARAAVAERYRLRPDSAPPWDNMSEEAQNLELAGMHEVVRTLGLFGWEVFRDAEGIAVRRIRVIEEPEAEPEEALRKVEAALDPTTTQQEAGTVPKVQEPQELCSICGQLSVVRESACRSRCYACGTIDGGCG